MISNRKNIECLLNADINFIPQKYSNEVIVTFGNEVSHFHSFREFQWCLVFSLMGADITRLSNHSESDQLNKRADTFTIESKAFKIQHKDMKVKESDDKGSNTSYDMKTPFDYIAPQKYDYTPDILLNNVRFAISDGSDDIQFEKLSKLYIEVKPKTSEYYDRANLDKWDSFSNIIFDKEKRKVVRLGQPLYIVDNMPLHQRCDEFWRMIYNSTTSFNSYFVNGMHEMITPIVDINGEIKFCPLITRGKDKVLGATDKEVELTNMIYQKIATDQDDINYKELFQTQEYRDGILQVFDTIQNERAKILEVG